MPKPYRVCSVNPVLFAHITLAVNAQTIPCVQCVAEDARCDRQEQCADLSDEWDCSTDAQLYFDISTDPPPALVRFDLTGGLTGAVLFQTEHIAEWFLVGNETRPCPETHFRCPGDGYCLPVYMRCNGVVDCPGGRDEAGCDASPCAGLYRCRGSRVCVTAGSVCDGLHHCPQHDDELFCDLRPCPDSCTCHGLAFACPRVFAAELYPDLRYLNAEGSAMTPGRLVGNSMLVHLSLASCGLQVLNDLNLPNLRSLDLSNNLITFISVRHLRGVANLQTLLVRDNPLTSLFPTDPNSTLTFVNLQTMDLSRTTLDAVDLGDFVACPNLHTLNFSHSSARKLYRSDPQSLQKLRVLDLRGCPVTEFQRDVISDLDDLQAVFAQNYLLCCAVVLPTAFNRKNCQAPPDAVSSCESLLASAAHSVSVAVCCFVALLGNVVSVIVRAFVVKGSGPSGTSVLVTHLAASDCLMGASLAVLAVADRLYEGRYVWEDTAWRHGAACRAIGFTSLLSSQVSSFLVFLITWDRLVSVVPGAACTKRFAFRPLSAGAACAVVWVGCALLAAWPLLPAARHWQLFSQTALCLPLPLATATATGFAAGRDYAFAVGVVLDTLLASAVAAGQTCIHLALRNSRQPSVMALTSKAREASAAGRVSAVCALSVVCRTPACLLGVLAWRGTPLAAGVRVGVALLALPVGSALRPCLYALAVRGQRRGRARTERLMAHVTAQRRQRGATDAKSRAS